MKKKILFAALVLFGMSWQLNSQVFIDENFDGGVPTGWNAGTYSPTTTAPCSIRSLRDNVYSFSAVTNTSSYSQTATGNDILVSFDYKIVDYSDPATSATTGDFGQLYLQYSVDGGTTWSNYDTINQTNHVVSTSCATWSNTILAADVPNGSNFAWKLDGVWANGDYFIYFDNFSAIEQVSCIQPGGLLASNITANSADIDWTENGTATTWNIEWGVPGFTPGTSTQIGSDLGNTSQTANLTGLNPQTTYEVYVQADCGGSQSVWSGPISFTTPQTPVSTFPWIEDFETGATNWTILNGTETNEWIVGGAVNNGGSNSLYISNDGGTSHAYTNSGATTRVHAYRDVELPATVVEAELSFDFLGDAETSYDNLRVFLVPLSYIPTAGSLITATGTAPTGRINLSGNVSEITSFENQSYTIPAAYSGQSFRIVFQWRNDGSGGQNPPAAVDNINLNVFNCNAPSGIVASNIDVDEALISWVDNTSGASSFQIEYGVSGFTPGIGAGTTVTATDTFVLLTGLTPDEDYDVYVSAECSDGTFSSQGGPGTFSTLVACDAPMNLQVLGVTTTTIDLDWTVSAGGPTNFIIEYGAPGFTPGTGTQVATPPFDLSGLNPDTEYDIYVYSDCGALGLSQPAGPVNATTLPTCPAPSDITISDIGTDSIVVSWTENGSATSWNIEYGAPGFTPGSGTVITGATNPDTITGLTQNTDYDIYVSADCGPGDISDTVGPETFTTLPTCPPVSNITFTNVGPNDVDVSWTAGGTETQWNLEYGPSGFTPGNGTVETGIGNPFTITGLTSVTEYDVYVTADCGGGDVADTTGPATFITDGTCGTYQLSLEDSWGDGWNGGSVTVYVNGTAVLTGATIASGSGPEIFNIPVNINDIISIDYSAGSFSGENSYELIDETGTVVVTEGASGTPNDFGNPSIPSGEVACPTCPVPTNIVIDTVSTDEVQISWTAGGSETAWNVEYDTTGFTLGNGNFIYNTTSNPITISGLSSGAKYDFYVQASCSASDSSQLEGPISFTTNYTCGDTIYDNGGPNGDYSVNSNDIFRVVTTTPNQYVKVTFEEFETEANWDGLYVYDGTSTTAPIIPSTNGPGNGNLVDPGAYWGNNIPGPFGSSNADGTLTFNFISDGSVTDPGFKAYVDCYDCAPIPGTDGSVDVCRLDDTLDLNSVITKGIADDSSIKGVWSFPANPGVLNDSVLMLSSLSNGTYEAMYIVATPCGADTAIATVNVYDPSSAGQNGSLTVCLNEPINLFDGLTGNVDLGGIWFDSSDNPLPNSQPSASNLPGSYNFDYITDNNVCPADTALVVVNVDGTCNWLSLGEEKLTDISVYPNPATSVINITNPSNSESLRVEMLDMNGRVVVSDSNALENVSEGTISIEHLEKGMYTLRIYNEEGQRTFKIVKQ